jgi:hypothetical protein
MNRHKVSAFAIFAFLATPVATAMQDAFPALLLQEIAIPSTCSPEGIPAGALRLQESVVLDPSLTSSGKPVAYMSLLAPADWKAVGSATSAHDDPCVWGQPLVSWSAISPDKKTRVDILPPEGWTVSVFKTQFSNCPSRPYSSAKELLEKQLDARRIAVNEATATDRMDIEQQLEYQRGGSSGNMWGSGVDATQLDFKTEVEGAPHRATAIAAIGWSTPAPGIPEDETRANAYPSLLGFFPMDASAAEDEAALLEMIRTSPEFNPAWIRAAQKKQGMKVENPPTERSPDEPFPARIKGADALMCGQPVTGAGLDGVWTSETGQYYFLPPSVRP